MAPYDDTAETYAAGYLWPIPVSGKTPPIAGATGYEGTVTPADIARWLNPAARARNGQRYDNTGLRHQGTLAIDVDHGYGGKDGVAALARFAAEHNLPPLPATWSSTARGDSSPSRQYLYRIPADVKFQTKPCPDVELCTWHHRYTVCAPSVHPDTGGVYAWYLPGADGTPPAWGDRTGRYPRVEAFAALPAAWFEVFRSTTSDIDPTAPVVELDALIGGFQPGAPDKLIAGLIAKWSNPRQHVGHDEFKQAALHALLLGREGHTGVRDLLHVLYRRLETYLHTARPGARNEARNLLTAMTVVAQQKPLSTPDPVDDDTWQAFLATFTDDPCPWMADNRATWIGEALATRPDTLRAFTYHATKAFGDVIQGRYSAGRAIATLTAAAPHGAADTTLRVALADALNTLEGTNR